MISRLTGSSCRLLIFLIWTQWASFSAMLNSVKTQGRKRKTANKANAALIHAAAVYMFQRISSAPNNTPSWPIPTNDDWSDDEAKSLSEGIYGDKSGSLL